MREFSTTSLWTENDAIRAGNTDVDGKFRMKQRRQRLPAAVRRFNRIPAR
jgi:hypothetical protein